MGVSFDAQARPRGASVGSVRVGGNGGSSTVVRQSGDSRLSDRSPSQSRPSSPADTRVLSRPFLPTHHDLDESPRVLRRRSRSRAKQQQQQQQDSPPQMSQVMGLDPRRQRRSERSISVSSAISTDRESFIDLFSPSNQDFPADFIVGPFTAASPTPSNFPRLPKPPVPTTPKPDFRRRTTTPLPPRRPSPVGPPAIPVRAIPPDIMPPTTNFLNPTERAQLIKKSRKLAQVFGQTPGAADLVGVPDSSRSSFLDVTGGPSSSTSGSGSKIRHRAAASMNNMLGAQVPGAQRPLPPWPAAEKTIHMTANGRRHSTSSAPLSDDAASVMTATTTEFAAHPGGSESALSSPRSFMDFSNNSNEDSGVGPDDSISVLEAALVGSRSKSNAGRGRGMGLPASPSSPSLFENMSPEERAEEERRKKRDKLAKLHRFLGSRVPTNLVLGPDHGSNSNNNNNSLDRDAPPLVAIALDGTLMDATDQRSGSSARSSTWVKRRRSSSAVLVSSWSDDLDRVKEDLNDKEKAIIVRRAQKMEKVFGVAPPQMLYNASANTSSASGSNSNSSTGLPASPTGTPPATYGSSYSNSNSYSQSYSQRNPNQAPYKQQQQQQRVKSSSAHRKGGGNGRPGTGDSGTHLLADAEPSAGSGSGAGSSSFVYTHYQHSLNSLHDIIDRNDKESLAELHQYLNDTGAGPAPISPMEFSGSSNGSTRSNSSRSKMERRRSLPARTSIASFASHASAASLASLASVNTIGTTASTTTIGAGGGKGSTASTPDADTSEFQQRRKRAAKLTQFFGVDYRDLIEDVLESIEHGLDAERRRGTLNQVEAEVLLQKLRTLKARR
ncbi:hypothetical protein C8R46DRAFT_500403 [Mycena filopes]|nr:hypothetical protein C8R46DRAFT_500403 [Mycena filopes]